MPVIFKVAAHAANPVYSGPQTGVGSSGALLMRSVDDRWEGFDRMMQSSVTEEALQTLRPASNGFVHTVVRAYGEHHHLTIRPDDVWIAILNQFNFYVNAHAEDLRSYFVAHQGQKQLMVWATGPKLDFGIMANQMTDKIREKLIDETLADWILPDFTTTTPVDQTVCSILMMATLKAYFRYGMGITCGIPSVTLEGQQMDYIKILDRLDRLDEFGEEPKMWAAMLRPILRRFISAFDGEPDIPFWMNVVHRDDSTCGIDDLTGWITAFSVWTSQGTWQGGKACVPELVAQSAPETTIAQSRWSKSLTLDGVNYPHFDFEDIAEGYAEVDVSFIDSGIVFKCGMIAGHVAMAVSAQTSGGVVDTVSPAPQWFMFTKKNATHVSADRYAEENGLDVSTLAKYKPVTRGNPRNASTSTSSYKHSTGKRGSKLFAKLQDLVRPGQ